MGGQSSAFFRCEGSLRGCPRVFPVAGFLSLIVLLALGKGLSFLNILCCILPSPLKTPSTPWLGLAADDSAAQHGLSSITMALITSDCTNGPEHLA